MFEKVHQILFFSKPLRPGAKVTLQRIPKAKGKPIKANAALVACLLELAEAAAGVLDSASGVLDSTSGVPDSPSGGFHLRGGGFRRGEAGQVEIKRRFVSMESEDVARTVRP